MTKEKLKECLSELGIASKGVYKLALKVKDDISITNPYKYKVLTKSLNNEKGYSEEDARVISYYTLKACIASFKINIDAKLVSSIVKVRGYEMSRSALLNLLVEFKVPLDNFKLRQAIGEYKKGDEFTLFAICYYINDSLKDCEFNDSSLVEPFIHLISKETSEEQARFENKVDAATASIAKKEIVTVFEGVEQRTSKVLKQGPRSMVKQFIDNN